MTTFEDSLIQYGIICFLALFFISFVTVLYFHIYDCIVYYKLRIKSYESQARTNLSYASKYELPEISIIPSKPKLKKKKPKKKHKKIRIKTVQEKSVQTVKQFNLSYTNQNQMPQISIIPSKPKLEKKKQNKKHKKIGIQQRNIQKKLTFDTNLHTFTIMPSITRPNRLPNNHIKYFQNDFSEECKCDTLNTHNRQCMQQKRITPGVELLEESKNSELDNSSTENENLNIKDFKFLPINDLRESTPERLNDWPCFRNLNDDNVSIKSNFSSRLRKLSYLKKLNKQRIKQVINMQDSSSYYSEIYDPSVSKRRISSSEFNYAKKHQLLMYNPQYRAYKEELSKFQFL